PPPTSTLSPYTTLFRSQFLAFASQPRALLQLPGVSRDENRKFVALFAAAHYRYFDNAPEESPYAAIAQLPAAQILKVRNGVVTRSEEHTSELQLRFDLV